MLHVEFQISNSIIKEVSKNSVNVLGTAERYKLSQNVTWKEGSRELNRLLERTKRHC
jgi:hypothetical protein